CAPLRGSLMSQIEACAICSPIWNGSRAGGILRLPHNLLWNVDKGVAPPVVAHTVNLTFWRPIAASRPAAGRRAVRMAAGWKRCRLAGEPTHRHSAGWPSGRELACAHRPSPPFCPLSPAQADVPAASPTTPALRERLRPV